MPTVNGRFTAEDKPADADLRRAEIVQRGKKAQREIGPARIAAQKAWQDWRMHGTFREKDGSLNQKDAYSAEYEWDEKPGIRLADGTREPGVRFQRLTGNAKKEGATAELNALKEKAEELDRRVLDLQDDLDIFMALVPSVMRKV